MRGEPSPNLVSLLARLKLATADDLRGVASRVRRLAGELPDFESVWVDALAQARVLTPFQAAEINAGRGDTLVKGPYVISKPLSGPHYAACFEARQPDSPRRVRLYVVHRGQLPASETLRALARLTEQSAAIAGSGAGVVDDAALTGDSVWAVCGAIQGTSAADWMAENGRFPPPVVAHIARETLARLAELERLGIVHGDVAAAGLLLQDSGRVAMPMAGLRSIVRPGEGYSFNDLQPEGYDYLAPERIADGGPPTVASDLYACGCLWWHLLTGRPPFPGGDSLAKLRAVHAAKVVDVRQLAPDVPEVLASAIEMCLAREPAARPQAINQLATMLGPPTRAGAAQLSRCLNQGLGLWQGNLRYRSQPRKKSKRLPIAAILAAAILIVVAGVLPFWRGRHTPQAKAVASARPNATADVAKPPRALPVTRAAHLDKQRNEPPSVKLATAAFPAPASAPQSLILPTGKKLSPSALDLKPLSRVHGAGGKRALVSVPAEGLRVDCEAVCFDGIDFVWETQRASTRPRNRVAAMINVAAQSVEFRGCSFSTAADAPPVAVAWTGHAAAAAGNGGEIIFQDCVFSGVAAVVDCRAAGGLSVEMSNSLCLTSGPIVRLNGMPRAEVTIGLSLVRTTTRGDTAVLECRYPRVEEKPGPITISATDCVLEGDRQGGLLVLWGTQRPERLMSAITWSGQGSLVTPHTPMAVWRAGSRKQQVLPENELEVAGLVRSSVEFAGRPDGPPSASRITRWQGPLRSADPPGALTHALSLPPR